MLIKKTKDFHRTFLYDLANISIYKNEYLDSLARVEREGTLDSVGFGNQPSKYIKFLGSYFKKPFDTFISDIDIVYIVKSIDDPNIYLRIPQIFKNLDKTRFRYIRIYSGYIQGLEPPWKIGDTGTCQFDYTKVKKWVKSLKSSYRTIYDKLKPFLLKDTISMLDLVNADEAIKPDISLTWTRDEIIQGYKIYNGVKYDFKQTMITYNKTRIIKFIYEYKGSYCLVDVNIYSNDINVSSGPRDIISYYTNNKYKKYKYLKKMLPKQLVDEYIIDTRNATGYITPLASYIDLINKLKKYKIASPQKIQELEKEASEYAKRNKIPTLDYDEIQKIILEKITPLYDKYTNFIEDKHKLNLFIIDVRVSQIEDQVPVNELIKRQEEGYDCPLFPVDVKQIRFLYFKCKDLKLDPLKVYKCILKACRKKGFDLRVAITKILDTGNFKILKKDNRYILFKDEKIVKISDKVEELQLVALKQK